MNKAEYIKFHESFCEQMVATTKKKNHDYTGGSESPFSNFEQIGNLVSVESVDVVAIGFMTRMSDKMSRVGSFLSKGELLIKDESVSDTLLDLANYCALFSGYLLANQIKRLEAEAELELED